MPVAVKSYLRAIHYQTSRSHDMIIEKSAM